MQFRVDVYEPDGSVEWSGYRHSRARPVARAGSWLSAVTPLERAVGRRVCAAYLAGAAARAVALAELPVLAAVDPAGLSGESRVDLIAAFERARAVLDGAQQAALAAVVEATEGVGLDGDLARHEVGAALRLSPVTAHRRTRTAADLARRLPATLAALQAGTICYLQAALLVDAVADLPDDTAAGVQARVLPRAAEQTVAETRRAVARAVIAADPDGAADRHDRAAARRRIERHAQPDAMAAWWITLPAHLEHCAWAALTATATATRTRLRGGAGEDPGLDALRVDALLDALHHQPDQPDRPHGATDPSDRPDGATDPSGADRTGGEASAAADTTARHSLGRDTGGQDVAGGDAAGADGEPHRTAPQRLPATSQRPLPRCRCGGVQTAAVVIDLPTLAGLAHNAGELPGYGPIPAGIARHLAADRDWQRWVIDPGTRALLDRGAHRYRPSDRLRAHITAAHTRCGFPGCSTPADRCDCDHRTTFHRGGRTTVINLGPLCRQHHNAKTHGRWRLAYDPDTTVLTWTSPLGKTYTKSTDPILE
jgi:hypothetical protein